MKPTSDDFKPRQDGWYEHRGVWEEVKVGTVIGTPNSRTDAWECIASAHPAQVEYGKTLWLRFRNLSSGDEYSAPPRHMHLPVTILTRDPADHAPAPCVPSYVEPEPQTPPTDQEAILAVIEGLGASHLATVDNITGQITCPEFPPSLAALIEHLEIAHGQKGLPNWGVDEYTLLHSRAHSEKYPDIGKGGFPHRHAPEDHTQM